MKTTELKTKLKKISSLCQIHDSNTGYFKAPCPYEINKLVIESLMILKKEEEK